MYLLKLVPKAFDNPLYNVCATLQAVLNFNKVFYYVLSQHCTDAVIFTVMLQLLGFDHNYTCFNSILYLTLCIIKYIFQNLYIFTLYVHVENIFNK